MRPETFFVLAKLVLERTGIAIREGKEYLVEARLTPLCRRHGIDGVDALARQVRACPRGPLVDEIMDAMTTNETSFFRDGAPYEALRKTVIPRLVEENADSRRLRIWSAACSSGQEPYSLSMLLREDFPALESWAVEIVATDLSPTMVKRTEDGVFSRHEVTRGLTREHLGRHFIEAGPNEYVIDPLLKRRIEVFQQNLLEPLTVAGPFDLVLLRNVLIYFEGPTRERVLERVRGVMRPGGVLLLGTAEVPDERSFSRFAEAGPSFFRKENAEPLRRPA